MFVRRNLPHPCTFYGFSDNQGNGAWFFKAPFLGLAGEVGCQEQSAGDFPFFRLKTSHRTLF